MASEIISVSNLKKRYGNVEAVKGIDFHVNEGELFAFLGPNGAGKQPLLTLYVHFLGQITVL